MALIRRRFLDKSEESKQEENQQQLDLDIQPQSYESAPVTQESDSTFTENAQENHQNETFAEESHEETGSPSDVSVSEGESEPRAPRNSRRVVVRTRGEGEKQSNGRTHRNTRMSYRERIAARNAAQIGRAHV